jgi:patatin-like phospholipase/acyl hydrolase
MDIAPLDLGDRVDIGNPGRRFRILALSGGGYRGLFTTAVLRFLEAKYGRGKSIGQRFDFVIGTSVGSLIGAGLACGATANQIHSWFRQAGPQIFSRNPLLIYWLRRLSLQPPYSPKHLREVVERIVTRERANAPIGGLPARFAAVILNYRTGQTEIAGTKHFAAGVNHLRPLVDAVLGSTAAPTYFPPHRCSGDILVDGGLVANAPDLVAYYLVKKNLMVNDEDIFILSIGTASQKVRGPVSGGELEQQDAQTVRLRRTRRLIISVLAAQEHLSTEIAATLMGPNFYRIDVRPSFDQARRMAALDRADESASATLEDLAQEAWTENHQNNAQLDAFFAD